MKELIDALCLTLGATKLKYSDGYHWQFLEDSEKSFVEVWIDELDNTIEVETYTLNEDGTYRAETIYRTRSSSEVH